MRPTLMAAAIWLTLAGGAVTAGEVKPRPAPKLPQKQWLNTPENKPLRFEQLRGKVVLVEFWTYG